MKDSESYVYLAGIQTLSVLADVDPKYVIPILACAVSRGTLSRGGKSGDSPLLLELDIQIKAAESLLFVIKRRGSALAQHANGLINELLVGCQSREEIPSRPNSNFTGQDMREIQEQTLSYFETASDSVINLQQDEKDEDLEEKMVRLKTGGPLFETEEHFAINSGCLLCLSEIIMTVPSNVFAPHHGSTLIKLCIECLRLDKNRPVRRGAALLAREIYNVVLRDAHQITENRAAAANKSSLPLMAMELCSSSNTYNDTLLFATLKNCVSGNDYANSNYCDPATLARCQEALTIREFCVDEGFFMVANLVSSSLLNSNSNGGVLDIIGNGDQFCTNLIHELT
uniref:RNA polymerase II assembly factor Rtp1 C-terminal domain-containing protein n=1 Tax=Proboscia inermis TaxID=420281 RepID=A0A7S0GGL5_9STRA